MGGAISPCVELEEEQYNMNHRMDSVDVVNEVTTGEYKNVEASDPIFQQGPQAPLCDLRNIPAACVPERMSGLTDQEVADVRLAQAATRGELKDIEQALRAGARVDTRAELHIAMGDASGSKPGKRTPLMRAAASGHLEVVKTLIRAGASIWRVDSRGWTPVCYALANGELALAYYLLSEAGNHRERQVKMAREHRLEVIDYCEEFTGANEADQLREAFASGLAGPEDAAARPERPEKSV
ncbi:unnamed protein product [Durusdinium trenchii]|uniref:Uncharacterized protein n=2 Tax=Durusdinium trenchii TaxID=1381693 RepID=A0ABP0PGY8_9DINO